MDAKLVLKVINGRTDATLRQHLNQLSPEANKHVTCSYFSGKSSEHLSQFQKREAEGFGKQQTIARKM
jgi:hypothetical protein